MGNSYYVCSETMRPQKEQRRDLQTGLRDTGKRKKTNHPFFLSPPLRFKRPHGTYCNPRSHGNTQDKGLRAKGRSGGRSLEEMLRVPLLRLTWCN